MRNILFIVSVILLFGCQALADKSNMHKQAQDLGGIAALATAMVVSKGKGHLEGDDAKDALKKMLVVGLATAAVATVAADVLSQRRTKAKTEKEFVESQINTVKQYNDSLDGTLKTLENDVSKAKADFRNLKTAYRNAAQRKGPLKNLDQRLTQELKENGDLLTKLKKELEIQKLALSNVKEEKSLKQTLQKQVDNLSAKIKRFNGLQLALGELHESVNSELQKKK